MALVLAGCGLALSLTTVADDAPQDLPSVVIVGRTLLDEAGAAPTEPPSNARIVSGGTMSEQGATNLADGLNATLGSVSVSNGTGNPYQNDVNYRGFQATSLLGAPVSISVYFDGMRMNDPFGSNVNWELIPMNAIERVEVMPGSNPIFGLNTLGGALVITTRNGLSSPGIALGTTAGSFRQRSGDIEAGWADPGRGTDYFLSARLDSQDGYRRHSGSRVDQFYGKARWHDREQRSQLELSAGHAETRVNGTQTLPLDMWADPSAAYTLPDWMAKRAQFASLRGSHRFSDVDALVASLYYRSVGTANENSNAELDDSCFDDEGSLASLPTLGTLACADKAPMGTAVNAVTGAEALALGYGHWTRWINTGVVASSTRERTLNATLQWTHTGDVAGHRHRFTLGAQLGRSHIRFGQASRLARLQDHATVVAPNLAYGFTANGAPPSADNRPVFTGSNLVSSVDLAASTRDVAVYAIDTFPVTDRLGLTLSGSLNQTSLAQSGLNAQFLNPNGDFAWTDDVKGISYYNPDYVPAFRYSNGGAGAILAPNGIPADAVAGPESNSLEGSHHYRRFNPALGFTYDLRQEVGLFGGYSEAMRAPTSIELSCADPNNPCALPTGFNGDPHLEPVVARTIELGGRGKLGPLDWNAALYRSRVGNDIQFIATSNSYGYFANVGDTERRGMELGLQQQWRHLFLSAEVGHVAARYQTPFTSAAGVAVDRGDRIPGIPSSTVKLRAAYAVGPALKLGGTLVVASSQLLHGNEGNDLPSGKAPGYSVLNLDLNYRIGTSFRFAVQLVNALDRRYSTYGLAGMTSIYSLVNQPFLTPAAPRAVRVSMSLSLDP